MNLQSYLDDRGVNYRLSRHTSAYTAQELAAQEHIPGRQVIKPVVVEADDCVVMCALPACYRVDLEELREQLMAQHVSLLDEARLRDQFPDCPLGSIPPIGALYGMQTLMDESLTRDTLVTFQAGSHEDSVTMTMADYRRLANPEIAHFARAMG